MADDNPTLPLPRMPEHLDDPGPFVRPEDYYAGFGEELRQTLDLRNWLPGRDLGEEYRRIVEEVRDAVEQEDELHREIREAIHSRLAWGPAAPKGAGRYEVSVEEIEEVHRGLLFNGAVETCDGTHEPHESLALTIHQIGIGLVSYRGDLYTWQTRLFRRDLRQRHGDPVGDAIELLERRSLRPGLNHQTRSDLLTYLASRAIMTHAERKVLVDYATAPWRLGHGSPAPLELLTGGGSADLMIESVKVIRRLIEDHRRFVLVTSEPRDRLLLTIGQALRPLEYAIVYTLRERLEPVLQATHFSGEVSVDPRWDGDELKPEQWLRRFLDRVASQVVVGVYRATCLAPAQIFYAHADYADIAARIVLADSVLQEERGWPLSIDLADRVCKSIYGGGSLRELAQAAYAAVGAPFRYQSERSTRPR
jgi:hypothetical protein